MDDVKKINHFIHIVVILIYKQREWFSKEGDMMSWLIDPIISWLTILVMRSGDSIGVKGILIFLLAVLGTGIALFVGAWLSGKNNE